MKSNDMDDELRDNYDDLGPSEPNPFAGRTKRPITIRVDPGTIAYFKEQAEQTGVPYQTLMNLSLTQVATGQLRLGWIEPAGGKSTSKVVHKVRVAPRKVNRHHGRAVIARNKAAAV
jgi:predicted DNA binding CopG/RHH family protein